MLRCKLQGYKKKTNPSKETRGLPGQDLRGLSGNNRGEGWAQTKQGAQLLAYTTLPFYLTISSLLLYEGVTQLFSASLSLVLPLSSFSWVKSVILAHHAHSIAILTHFPITGDVFVVCQTQLWPRGTKDEQAIEPSLGGSHVIRR